MSKFIDFGKIQTESAKVIELINQATNVSYERYPALIIGESGTGRRLLAEYMHEKSDASLPFFRINNTDFPSLGQIKSGCTILIENLDNLDFIRQEKVISLIAHLKKSERPIFWIATGSVNITENARNGNLRRDLYDFFRLQVLRTIPLRDRVSDIRRIAEKVIFTLNLFSDKKVRFSENYLESLKALALSGNVDQLEKKIEADYCSCTSQVLDIDDENLVNDVKLPQIMTLAEMEKRLILQTLTVTQNKKTQAAKMLGISIRTLRNKMSIYSEEGVA